MYPDRVESPQTENLSARIHAYRGKICVRGDMDGPAIAAREGRKRIRHPDSPSTNFAVASEGRKGRERSASPSRADSTAKRRRRERSPVGIKTWEQDFGLPSPNLQHPEDHAIGLNRDSSTAVLLTNSPSLGEEEPGKEHSNGEPTSSSFKLVERLLQNVAAGATLLPSWDEQLRMMVECTEQELSMTEPVPSGSDLPRHPLRSIQDVHPPQEPEVATLVNPLESFHISEPSSATNSGSSGPVSPVGDGGNTIPLESADVTLKPAIWGKHEVEVEYAEDDDEEDEENTYMFGPYDPPTYGTTSSQSPPSPPPYASRVTYQRTEDISRYWKPNKGRRFQPYHARTYRPEPHSSPDAYTTVAPESSGGITLGSIILARMKEDMALASADVDCSGKRSLPREKNNWRPLTQRKGMDAITHKFKKLVLGV